MLQSIQRTLVSISILTLKKVDSFRQVLFFSLIQKLLLVFCEHIQQIIPGIPQPNASYAKIYKLKKSYSNVVFIAKLIKHVLFFDSKQAMNFQIQITTNFIFCFVVMFPNNISRLHISAYCGDSILHLNHFTINVKKKNHLFYNLKFK